MCATRATPSNRGPPNRKDRAMTSEDIQNLIQNILERLLDAKDAIEGDDDDIELADIAREMVDDADGVTSVVGYDDVMMLTNDEGLVIRTSGGDEFQITIVQSKYGSDE